MRKTFITSPTPWRHRRIPPAKVSVLVLVIVLDLFREHPEEIVIAEEVGLDAKFSRLSDRPDLDEIIGDAPLSEVWYSGVLGGVPLGT